MSNIINLSQFVSRYLRTKYLPLPSKSTVQQLIEILFYSSLKTEEGRGVTCTVAFVTEIDKTDSSPPLSRRPQRRSYIPLERPLSLSVRNLAKFSQAARPWASCIAIHAANGHLEICGLFDQEIYYQTALNIESEVRLSRPGLFQAELTAPGSLTIYDGRKLLARMNGDTLVTDFHDVLNEGPIAKQLGQYLDKLENAANEHLRKAPNNQIKTFSFVEAPRLWLQTLSRILLGIARLKHGGALLLSPTNPTPDLTIKYPIKFSKIEELLAQHLAASVRWERARESMRNEQFKEGVTTVPIAMDIERRSAFNEREDAKKAEIGCINFIAALSGVDGLILMSGGLKVIGFGVEISKGQDPSRVLSARDARGTGNKLLPLDFTHFGTRHRSMMRYCDRNPGAIGFVISQDGDVRAITKTEHGVVVWENIALREVDVVGVQRSPRDESRIKRLEWHRKQIDALLPNSLFYENQDRIQDVSTERCAWMTAAQDPLKVVINKKDQGSRVSTEIYYSQQGFPIIAIVTREIRHQDTSQNIEAATYYYDKWVLIRKEIRTNSLSPHSRTGLKRKKPIFIDGATLSDSERTSEEFRIRGEETMQILVKEGHICNVSATPEHADTEHYRLIQGTTSPDGRFSIGLGLQKGDVQWETLEHEIDPITGYQHYFVEKPESQLNIPNYVIENKTQKIVGETGVHYIGTRRNFNWRSCSVCWSPTNRFLLQIHQAKWHTLEAITCMVDANANRLFTLDILGSVSTYAYRFLSDRRDRSFRRFGEKFAISISCEEVTDNGIIVLRAFGEIPKSTEDDTNFEVVERLKIGRDAAGIKLKLIHIQKRESTWE